MLTPKPAASSATVWLPFSMNSLSMAVFVVDQLLSLNVAGFINIIFLFFLRVRILFCVLKRRVWFNKTWFFSLIATKIMQIICIWTRLPDFSANMRLGCCKGKYKYLLRVNKCVN